MLRGASPSVRTFASLATPTTSRRGTSSRRRTSGPTASPSVQKRRALASLMIATGCASCRSPSLMVRPSGISMPAASKNLGSTSARSAMKAPWSGGGSTPSTLKSLKLLLSWYGSSLLMAPPDPTPGAQLTILLVPTGRPFYASHAGHRNPGTTTPRLTSRGAHAYGGCGSDRNPA